MYNQIPRVALNYSTSLNQTTPEKPLDIGQLFRFLQKNRITIAISTALFLLTALAYVLLTPPTFIASAQLMSELRKEQSTDAVSSITIETLAEGQIEIIKSSEVLLQVVRRLALDSDPEFASRLSTVNALRSLATTFRRDTAAADAEQMSAVENRTIAKLRNRLGVRRVGQSTVIEVSMAAKNPKTAAAIANAVAEQYVAHNVAMKSQSARASSEWLEQRVEKLREDVFTADSAVAKFQVSGDPNDHFRLAELKSVANTSRRLYETYLLNWSEAKQKISYPLSDASLVSRAAVPISKSQPKSTLIVLFALVLGASVGVIAAIIRDFSNGVITSTDRIASATATRCLGTVALVNCDHAKMTGRIRNMPRVAGFGRAADDRHQRFNGDFRDLKATVAGLRRVRKAKLIGIVGAGPTAGATTVAYNLAALSSTSGSRTLLIDASAANPTLSRAFAGERSTGLMEILNNAHAYIDFIGKIDKRLTVLPIGAFGEVTPGERIASERIAFSFADLKERFDLILVDLPSIPGSADAKAIAPYLDGTIIVVRYGATSTKILAEAVDAFGEVGAEILGIVLNATPERGKWGELLS